MLIAFNNPSGPLREPQRFHIFPNHIKFFPPPEELGVIFALPINDCT